MVGDSLIHLISGISFFLNSTPYHPLRTGGGRKQEQGSNAGGAPNAFALLAEEGKKERILGQVEYYFSPDNLARDVYFRKQV